MLKKNRLLERVENQERLNKAVSIANTMKEQTPSTTTIKELLRNEDIRSVMEDILETSRMTEPMKAYIRGVFIERKTKKQAIQKAFGRDLGYQEEAITGSIMESAPVKEFVDMIKMFYVRVAPIAALKEVEVMLDPHTDAENKLKAARQIKEGAGIGTDGGKGQQLPVRIVINMPQQTNINAKISLPEKGGKDEVKTDS